MMNPCYPLGTRPGTGNGTCRPLQQFPEIPTAANSFTGHAIPVFFNLNPFHSADTRRAAEVARGAATKAAKPMAPSMER